MEVNCYSHFEQSYLINELTQGMGLARQLSAQMGPEHSTETKEILLQQIVSSYDNALLILGCGAPAEPPHQLVPVQSPLVPSSPSSNSTNKEGNVCSLKRKSASRWTKQVKLNPENGLDGPVEDGYSWRKYGQKDILGAKNPRSYYRCTYRNVQDCWATRQVQRSEKDPTVFDITYRGKHTCNMIRRRSKSAPTSPGKQEAKLECQQDSAMVMSFETAPPPNNPEMHNNNNNNNLYGDFSTSLVSPSTTSHSNYFSISGCKLESFPSFQHREQNMGVDIADMILAATSSANSPTIDPDFSLDLWSFNQNLPFNDPGFFS